MAPYARFLLPPVLLLTTMVAGCAPASPIEAAGDARSPAAEAEPVRAVDPSSGDRSGGEPTHVGDGLSLTYPASFEAIGAGGEAAVRAGASVPACADGFLACVRYAGPEIEASTLTSAGVGVHRREAADAAACESTEGNFAVVEEVRRETLGDVRYLVFATAEAATSHVAHDEVFRTWRDGRCWELVARIGSTNPGAYEPGTIAEFSDARREALRATLRSIVASFALEP